MIYIFAANFEDKKYFEENKQQIDDDREFTTVTTTEIISFLTLFSVFIRLMERRDPRRHLEKHFVLLS